MTTHTHAKGEQLEIFLFWACLLLFAGLEASYAVIGFWYVNGRWIRAAWRVIWG